MVKNLNKVRTRIAPSPTGRLHVGTARSALFNELYARQQGGSFIVRVEDTDQERTKGEFETEILASLKWLGLKWDEGPDVGGKFGPYRQSERTGLYQKALEKLLNSGGAYELEGGIYLKVKAQTVAFSDIIRGQIKIHTDAWGGDFVIARAINNPVYHLAVVVDDAEMEISHVIRGEDHLSNTARHILLQQSLGYKQPIYAHLPLLLDDQRHKLSKRSGGGDGLMSYREKGFLPEAVLNYLALLGWSPNCDEEIFTHEQLVRRFNLKDVQKGSAIFSEKKMLSINKHYLKLLSPEKLLSAAKPHLLKAGVVCEDNKLLTGALATEQTRVSTLAELPEAISFFLPGWRADFDASLLVWRSSAGDKTVYLMEKLINKIGSLDSNKFQEKTLNAELLDWIKREKMGRGDVLWPMRVALTGREHSPGPFEVAAVLGKRETLKRLNMSYRKLASGVSDM